MQGTHSRYFYNFIFAAIVYHVFQIYSKNIHNCIYTPWEFNWLKVNLGEMICDKYIRHNEGQKKINSYFLQSQFNIPSESFFFYFNFIIKKNIAFYYWWWEVEFHELVKQNILKRVKPNKSEQRSKRVSWKGKRLNQLCNYIVIV